jgi:hypothetical protein
VDDAKILASIKEITQSHPFWGYRRVRAWLKYREGLPVGYKRVYRLMKEHELLVPQIPSAAASPVLGHRYDQVPHPKLGLGLPGGRVGLVQLYYKVFFRNGLMPASGLASPFWVKRLI